MIHFLWLVYTGGCGTDTSCLVIYIPFAGGMWFWAGTLALAAWAIEGVQWWWLRGCPKKPRRSPTPNIW